MCCDFTQPVEVKFDGNHEYILDDKPSRDSFVLIHRNWVNLKSYCDEDTDGNYIFEVIVFSDMKTKKGLKPVLTMTVVVIVMQDAVLPRLKSLISIPTLATRHG